MPYHRLILDHITVVARSLDEGVAHVCDALGINMPSGGAHPAMGTHNRLMALGPDFFLEVIAVDPDAPQPSRSRWFALDDFDSNPQLGTWVLSTPNIPETLAELPASVGQAVPITRDKLSWLISIPDDGSMPMSGAFPTMIEWSEGTPAGRITDLGCRLHSLSIEHTDADRINTALDGQFVDQRVTVRNGLKKQITAEIETPTGLRVLR